MSAERTRQLSVFVDGSRGNLERVCSILAQADINILTMSVAERNGGGMFRAVVDKTVEAMEALKQNGFFAKDSEVLCVELDDAPGSLSSVLKKIAASGAGLEYMYPMSSGIGRKRIVVMSFKDIDAAERLLQ